MSELISILRKETGLSEITLRRIIGTAPKRYKNFNIKKKNGGYREISQPSKELKTLQRIITDKILLSLPIHDAATAYRKGSSIFENASRHIYSNAILKMDFSNFFPSIKFIDWEKICLSNKIFNNREDIDLSGNILFHTKKNGSILHLAIGAPSSPALSNAIMYDFDVMVSAAVASDKVIYTRYADDMTFSADRMGNLKDIPEIIKRVIKTINSPKLSINSKKQYL